MARTGSVIAQTGLSSGRTAVAGQGKLSQGYGAIDLAVEARTVLRQHRAQVSKARQLCRAGLDGGTGHEQGRRGMSSEGGGVI